MNDITKIWNELTPEDQKELTDMFMTQMKAIIDDLTKEYETKHEHFDRKAY